MALSTSQAGRHRRAECDAGVQFYQEFPTGSPYMVHICTLTLHSGTKQQLEEIQAKCKSEAKLSSVVVTAIDALVDMVPFVMADGRRRLIPQPAQDVLGRTVAVGLPITEAEKSLEMLNCLLGMGYKPQVRMLNNDRWTFWERKKWRRCRDRQ